METIQEVRAEVGRLANIICAPPEYLPTFGQSADGGRPHIEIDAGGYHYIVVERGSEQYRDTTYQTDALLYLVFQSVTFEMACRWELKHRVAAQDFRRLLWQKQLCLLEQLSSKWKARRSCQIEQILSNNPYSDQDCT